MKDALSTDDVKRRNRQLCERYPFLIPRDPLTGERLTDFFSGSITADGYGFQDYDYEFTELDDMPDGWRAAFGEQMCEELREALLREGGEEALNHYMILQIKEKYGGLRWYSFGYTRACDEVIKKYERLSEVTCIRCGRPATKISRGWIMPFCDECAEDGREYIPIKKENCYE